MIDRFANDPAAVLADFRRRCGDETAFGPADIRRLLDDLVTLRDGDCTAAIAAWPAPILSLQGARDPLLPAPMRDAVFAATRSLERMTCPDGGHLLPITDTLYCAGAIRAFAEHVG
jgi:pimeloyl-[acyl-carrier protein] methyl ester esterase